MGIPTFSAFRFPGFRLLWAAQLGQSMGIWMDNVSRLWLMYELTGSTLDLGLVSAVRVVPMLIVSPLAGTMADRYDRKTQLLSAQSLHVSANLAIAILVLTHVIEPWHVFVIGFVDAIGGAFESPARQAMLSETIDRPHLTNAIALMSMVFNVSRTVGPALAGALIALAGTGGAYVGQAATYGLAVLLTLLLNVGKVDQASERSRSFASSTLAGWRYVAGHQSIRTVLLVMTFTAMFGMSFTTLLPVFARDILDVGASGQGLLLTGMGIGALSAAFCVASIGERLPKGAVIITAALVYGLSVLAFSQSVWFPVSFLLMVASGFANVACATVTQTVVQGQAEPEMRGRVMAAYQQIHTLMIIGGILAGALAGSLGAPTTLLAMGATLGASALVILALMPHIRHIR